MFCTTVLHIPLLGTWYFPFCYILLHLVILWYFFVIFLYRPDIVNKSFFSIFIVLFHTFISKPTKLFWSSFNLVHSWTEGRTDCKIWTTTMCSEFFCHVAFLIRAVQSSFGWEGRGQKAHLSAVNRLHGHMSRYTREPRRSSATGPQQRAQPNVICRGTVQSGPLDYTAGLCWVIVQHVICFDLENNHRLTQCLSLFFFAKTCDLFQMEAIESPPIWSLKLPGHETGLQNTDWRKE